MSGWQQFLAQLGRGVGKALTVITGPRLQLWAMVLGAPVITAMLWLWVEKASSFRWPPELRATQLDVLRESIRMAFALLGTFVLAIAAGLITGVKLQGPGGFSAEIDTADSTQGGEPVKGTVEGEVLFKPEKPDA